MISIEELWNSLDPQVWELALERYWQLVKPANLELERALDNLELSRIRQMGAPDWYDFLLNEYLRWKYTAPNRYATTTRSLKQYAMMATIDDLYQIKERLLAFDQADIREGLSIAREIKGLGIAGASGLLALMYPTDFGTVDQFVVKALRAVSTLPEAAALAKMNPESLSIDDGILCTAPLKLDHKMAFLSSYTGYVR